mmetsp:Transcript_68815/g.183096  ORF Transcript_68815/g.183096 Transcript_68815/m.183096 type:complete len:145 (+) Transcript_68815:107-541(+)
MAVSSRFPRADEQRRTKPRGAVLHPCALALSHLARRSAARQSRILPEQHLARCNQHPGGDTLCTAQKAALQRAPRKLEPLHSLQPRRIQPPGTHISSLSSGSIRYGGVSSGSSASFLNDAPPPSIVSMNAPIAGTSNAPGSDSA